MRTVKITALFIAIHAIGISALQLSTHFRFAKMYFAPVGFSPQSLPLKGLICTQPRRAKMNFVLASSPQSPLPLSPPQNHFLNVPTPFVAGMAASGALLGPYLDNYHSHYHVLQYHHPVHGPFDLTTALWTPPLFALAGVLIGYLYTVGDRLLNDKAQIPPPPTPTVPFTLTSISFFTFQYWLSGILSINNVDGTTIFLTMSTMALLGFLVFDRTIVGFWTSLATAIGGPLIEIGLLSTFHDYHYLNSDFGPIPGWIIPVYFLGGPANGNLARAGLKALQDKSICPTCQNSRVQPCVNCDALGYYISYNQKINCTCCNGSGQTVCRLCFRTLEIENSPSAVREFMKSRPD
ncbi:hypothetical protein TrLO_g12012 [Triparma laevis f. longispina]|uniref:Uncharacterized protein n=1 Tax=Triparma laevis f. longispina TaxID=1714387 RepID=A0A9W7FSF4_9STRA|nr:hypothetical protein TrLO_g12012 [Triparma laevis f. longispina]